MQQGIKRLQWFEYLKVVFLEILNMLRIMSGFYESDHVYVCMYVCTYICMYVRMYVHTYVCMYIRMIKNLKGK